MISYVTIPYNSSRKAREVSQQLKTLFGYQSTVVPRIRLSNGLETIDYELRVDGNGSFREASIRSRVIYDTLNVDGKVVINYADA